jgi:hypothetical protein
VDAAVGQQHGQLATLTRLEGRQGLLQRALWLCRQYPEAGRKLKSKVAACVDVNDNDEVIYLGPKKRNV